jgi:hypothetical protein
MFGFLSLCRRPELNISDMRILEVNPQLLEMDGSMINMGRLIANLDRRYDS